VEILRFIQAEGARFELQSDAFVTISQDGEQEIWQAEEITISDGSRIKAYPVGAGAWMWEVL
jgi:hypothetical protein